jgi:hypothetical protein
MEHLIFLVIIAILVVEVLRRLMLMRYGFDERIVLVDKAARNKDAAN